MRNLLIRYMLIFILMGVWAWSVEEFPEALGPDSYLRGILRNAALLIPMIGLLDKEAIRKMSFDGLTFVFLLIGWTITLVVSCTSIISTEPISVARWSNFVFLSPFLEEVVFRGVFLSTMITVMNKTRAVILSSVLFSLLHLPQFLIFGYDVLTIIQNLGFIATLGAIFALLTIWSKRLWPSTLVHAANNCLALL